MPPSIHPTAIIDPDCQIGEGTKIWHFSHVMSNCTIGRDCILGQNVFVAPLVVLGDRVKVQNNVSLYTGVVCEDDVFVGPSVVFTNVLNPRSFIDRKAEFKKTLVRKGATIGANATVVCGNTIGRYALVGAGAVVSKPVPDYALVAGNPAVQIGWISERGHTLTLDGNGMATCPGSGQQYQLVHDKLVKIGDDR